MMDIYRQQTILENEGPIHVNTSRRFRPITTAKPEAATGNPCPICPYAFPATEAATPRSASVVANPNENAIESPMIWLEKRH